MQGWGLDEDGPRFLLAAVWTTTHHWSLKAHSVPVKQGCGPPLVYNPSGL